MPLVVVDDDTLDKTIVDLNVEVHITHTYTGDLEPLKEGRQPGSRPAQSIETPDDDL